MIGRTTTREFPLTFTNNLTSATMPSQPFSRASPSEGLSTARQVMADAVTFYLDHGGPAEARLHVEKVANELGLPVGPMHYIANNFHCYSRDREVLANYCKVFETAKESRRFYSMDKLKALL